MLPLPCSRFFAIALCLTATCGPVWAAAFPGSEPEPARKADWDRRLTIAQAQQQAGKAKKAEAKKLFEAEKVACFEKFRVTDCQEEARRRYVVSTNEARRIENDGLALERQVKKEQLADKAARYEADAPLRAADRAQREAKVAEARQKSEEKRSRKIASQQEKTKQGAERRARDAERLEKKKARHEQKVAEQMAKSKRRAAGTPAAPPSGE